MYNKNNTALHGHTKRCYTDTHKLNLLKQYIIIHIITQITTHKSIQYIKHTKVIQYQGRIQEFWLGVDFFFRGMGSGGQVGEAPVSSWILMILGVKNHIISPHRWIYTLSYKKKCTFVDTLYMRHKCNQNFFPNQIYKFIIELWFESIIGISWIWTHTTHSCSHHLLDPASTDFSRFWNECIFFHKNIVANWKCIIWGRKKSNQSKLNKQF